jgi:hypothetical protein
MLSSHGRKDIMMTKSNSFGAVSKLARYVATFAIAAAMLAALSVAPASAQCRGRVSRVRPAYSQQYRVYSQQYRRAPVYSQQYYGNNPYYYSAPAYTYDPYYRPSSKGKDTLTVVGGAAAGALVGGLVGGKKGAIIGAAAGAGVGGAVVYKRHRNNNYYYNNYPYPY